MLELKFILNNGTKKYPGLPDKSTSLFVNTQMDDASPHLEFIRKLSQEAATVWNFQN